MIDKFTITPVQKMPIWLKVLFGLGIALLILCIITALNGSKGAGGPAGWGSGFLYYIASGLLIACLIWGFASWFVYKSLFAYSSLKRISISILFFLSPFIYLFMQISYEWLKGNKGSREDAEYSSEAIALAGQIFPKNSQVQYIQDGEFGRNLSSAISPTELMFHKINIMGITLEDPPSTETLKLTLSKSQQIDGWECSTADYAVVTQIAGKIKLERCVLEQQSIAGTMWPAGTTLQLNDQSWILYSSTMISADSAIQCDNPITINGIEYAQVMARLDQKQKIHIENGVRCSDRKTG